MIADVMASPLMVNLPVSLGHPKVPHGPSSGRRENFRRPAFLKAVVPGGSGGARGKDRTNAGASWSL
jgi:hypothetical protein